MEIQLVPLAKDKESQFIADIQLAFQRGYEDKFGPTSAIILPEKDVRQSLEAVNAQAFWAVSNQKIVGGVVVNIDPYLQVNDLDLLFVKNGVQGKGIGQAIWLAIEQKFPCKKWETYTPYFEQRNIHFYVNVCGFQIVEYFNQFHPMPNVADDFIGDGNEGMFKLVKKY